MSDGILTSRQFQLIGSTWELCKTDLQATGVVMFIKLFEISPDLISLFPFGDQAEISEETEGLRKHALGVMETVDAAIDMVAKGQIEELVATLLELGAKHTMHSVEPVHFAPVGEALLYAIGSRAGDAFTDETKEAWIALYSVVQAKMTEGMEELGDM